MVSAVTSVAQFPLTGKTTPLIKWAGGKHSSGVCNYLKPLYQSVRNKFPLYVSMFGGALGDVYNVMPERFIAIDSEFEVSHFYRWVLANGVAYIPAESKADYMLLRERFNNLNLAYADFSFETLEAISDNLDKTEPGITDLLNALSVYNKGSFTKAVSDDENGIDSKGARLINDLIVECERELACMFYWINKNSFNGIWRKNGSGRHNVNSDHKPTAKILTQEKIEFHIQFLSRGEYHTDDFSNVISYLPEGKHFIYIDPPYDGTYNKYSSFGFTAERQIELANLAADLVDDGHFVVASNSFTEDMISLYSDYDFEVRRISARRRVNCKGEGRANKPEMLAFGYRDLSKITNLPDLDWDLVEDLN